MSSRDRLGSNEIELNLLMEGNSDQRIDFESIEDALIRPKYDTNLSQACFAQFKYSSKRQPSDIKPTEFEGILDHFYSSAEKYGEKDPCEYLYVLGTNRELSPWSKKIKKFYKGTRDKSPPKELDETQLDVFNNLVLLKKDLHESLEQIRSVGRNLGLGSETINQRIGSLIGLLGLDQANELPEEFEIDEQEIINRLSDRNGSKPLNEENLIEARNQIVDQFNDQYLAIDEGNENLIERDCLGDLISFVKQHSVVVIKGNGGCGKSICLWQWAKRSEIKLIELVKASNLKANWAKEWFETIGWKHFSPENLSDQEKIERIINRIKTTDFGEEKPVFYIGVDGYDEFKDKDIETSLKKIIRFFLHKEKNTEPGEIPEATLIITARTTKEDYLLDELSEGTQPNLPSPQDLTVGKFDEDEISVLCENFDEEIENKLNYLNNRYHKDGKSHSDKQTVQKEEYSQKLIDPQFMESLSYPSIWGRFSKLSKIEKEEILHSNDLSKLAHEFIEWFVNRTDNRLDHNRVDEEKLKQMLSLFAFELGDHEK